MNEQLFLGGAAVGIGADPDAETHAYALMIGVPLAGLIGGAIIGNHVKNGAVGITVGSVAGLATGMVGIALISRAMARSSSSTTP